MPTGVLSPSHWVTSPQRMGVTRPTKRSLQGPPIPFPSCPDKSWTLVQTPRSHLLCDLIASLKDPPSALVSTQVVPLLLPSCLIAIWSCGSPVELPEMAPPQRRFGESMGHKLCLGKGSLCSFLDNSLTQFSENSGSVGWCWCGSESHRSGKPQLAVNKTV